MIDIGIANKRACTQPTLAQQFSLAQMPPECSNHAKFGG